MTARAQLPRRRGACPGLSAPMPTGDGLLVRLMPTGTMPLAAFAELCEAARTHGNGVIEVTARGSIQVRGLDAASAPPFAAAVAALDIAAADGIPVLSNALAGLDPTELIDARKFAAELRGALARRSPAAPVAAKISVVIDGGGALGLDGIAADLRLCAEPRDGGVALCISVGGDRASATELGMMKLAHGTEAALRLLEVIARHGRDARARDVLAAEGIAVFRAAVKDWLIAAVPHGESVDPAMDSRQRSNERAKAETIGLHRLGDETFACGIGIAFGHADAAALQRLIEAARDNGASGMRTAPGRALMMIGVTKESSSLFAAAAERLGFVVRADDPRRHVVACAGAPICSAAQIAARDLGPVIAAAAAPHIGDGFTIHISGCAKGCAHAAAAALTIVGTPGGCALIANGSARDTPNAVVPADEVPAAVAKLAQQHKREAGHV